LRGHFNKSTTHNSSLDYLSIMKVTTLTLLTLSGFATVATAQVHMLVDFGNLASRHSVEGADTNGNQWNYVTGASDTIADLDLTSGAASGIGLAVAGFTGPGTYNGGLTPNSSLGDFAFPAVTDDALFFTDNLTPTLTLTGLDNGLTYTLNFYGARVTTSSRTTTYAIGLDSVALVTSGTAIGSDGSNWNDDTIVSLSAMPTAGSLVVDLSATGGFGYVNAMSISAIPEPSVLATLLGLGALGFLSLRRRR
jgi:hypothetical protein